MPQSSYPREFGGPFAGQKSDSNPARVSSYLNKSGGSLNAGLGLIAQTANSNPQSEATTPALTTDELVGVNLLQMATDPDNIAGTANFHEGVVMPVLQQGSVWVAVDFAVAYGDPVYVRFGGAGTGTVNVNGAFGNSADSGKCRLVKGARWLQPQATAGGTAELYIDVQADQVVH